MTILTPPASLQPLTMNLASPETRQVRFTTRNVKDQNSTPSLGQSIFIPNDQNQISTHLNSNRSVQHSQTLFSSSAVHQPVVNTFYVCNHTSIISDGQSCQNAKLYQVSAFRSRFSFSKVKSKIFLP